MASPDYFAWPLLRDVRQLMTSVNVTTRFEALSNDEDDYIQTVIDAVVEELEQETHRQFIPDVSDTSRVYDGNGTSQMDIDDMVSLTGVTILGVYSDPGYTITDVVLTEEYRHGRSRLVAGHGSIPALSAVGVYHPTQLCFPVGRQNIQVTGQFGYATSIPKDVWNAVAGECAHRIAQNTVFRPLGRVTNQKTVSESITYKVDLPVIAGWRERYRHILARYRRRSSPRLRELRGRMI